MRNSKYFHPRPSEDDLMRHMEARLGASTAQLGGDKLGKFLRHDRQVRHVQSAGRERKAPRAFAAMCHSWLVALCTHAPASHNVAACRLTP